MKRRHPGFVERVAICDERCVDIALAQTLDTRKTSTDHIWKQFPDTRANNRISASTDRAKRSGLEQHLEQTVGLPNFSRARASNSKSKPCNKFSLRSKLQTFKQVRPTELSYRQKRRSPTNLDSWPLGPDWERIGTWDRIGSGSARICPGFRKAKAAFEVPFFRFELPVSV